MEWSLEKVSKNYFIYNARKYKKFNEMRLASFLIRLFYSSSIHNFFMVLYLARL